MSLREAQVHILQNVPLDPAYVNSIYFTDSRKQHDYFYSKRKWSFSEMSYVKVDRGSIRVKQPQEFLTSCNYLMFRERNSGQDNATKWFYAFIKDVIYVADNVSEILFEIDVIQTWMFEWEMLDSYIDRGHTLTDNYTDHLIDEQLDCGSDLITERLQEYDLGDNCAWVLTSQTWNDGQQPVGRLWHNIYTSLFAYKFVLPRDLNELNRFIDHYVSEGQENAIVGIYQAPSRFGLENESLTFRWRIPKPVAQLNDYHPRNKKLLTYPYKQLKISNNQGDTATFRWEDFEEDAIQPGGYYSFKISGVTVPAVEIMCYPVNYQRVAENYDYGLAMTSFPQCAWVGDPYKVWMAQHSLSARHGAAMKAAMVEAPVIGSIMSAIPAAASTAAPSTALVATSGATAAGGATAAAGAGAAFSTFGPIIAAGAVIGLAAAAPLMIKKHELENTPPQIHGQARTTNLNYAIGRVKYTAYYQCIKREFAEAIDSFFDVYGYAIHKLGIPKLNVRPHWTYIKTAGCNMRGPIPATAMVLIKGIFDRGITFWANGEEVGNYGLDNSPR